MGAENDPEELAWLLEKCGADKNMASFRNWPKIKPGRTNKDIDGSGFTAAKFNPNRPARSIMKNDGIINFHGAMHWAERRRFTTAEFKRFCGFPDDFRFVGTWSNAVARIGNSVPPPMMFAIAKTIRERILES
jgi:DNA (cytosine-5)-methyltransferase 1